MRNDDNMLSTNPSSVGTPFHWLEEWSPELRCHGAGFGRGLGLSHSFVNKRLEHVLYSFINQALILLRTGGCTGGRDDSDDSDSRNYIHLLPFHMGDRCHK